MSQRDPFDVTLTGWLEDEAAGMAPPDLHGGAMRAARQIRQRPTWLVAVRGGLDAGPRIAGRLVPARTIIVVVALLLLAAVFVVAAGRLLNNEPLFGVANGRIMVALEGPAGLRTTSRLVLTARGRCRSCRPTSVVNARSGRRMGAGS